MGSLMVFGFIKGFQPIAGFSYGAKLYKRLTEAIKISVLWSTIFCVLYGAICAIFSKQVISLFTTYDEQMILIGQKALVFNELSFMLFGFFTVYSSLLLSMGKGRAGFIVGALRQGICFIPAILILPHILGLDGIIFAQPIADIIARKGNFIASCKRINNKGRELPRPYIFICNYYLPKSRTAMTYIRPSESAQFSHL